MPKLDKNKYNLVINPDKDLFRWKVDAYPALIYSVCCGMMRIPYGWPKSEGFFFGHDFYWYNNWVDIWGNGDRYLKKYGQKSRGDFDKNYYRQYNRVFAGLKKEINKLEKINFRDLSLPELRRHWFRFFKYYSYQFWMIVTISEVVSYAASHRLEQEINKQGLKIPPEDISRLTIFPEQSFLMAEEYELLKISQEKNRRRQSELIRQHAQKFFWILNGYHGVKKLTEQFFIKRLAALIKNQAAVTQLAQLKNYSCQVGIDFKRIVKKYKLNATVIKYAKLAQRAAYLQDKRKGFSFIAIYYIVEMYAALARHLNISLEEALYITWPEFDAVLKEKRLLKEIARRQKYCRLRMTPAGTIISLEKVPEIFKYLENKYSGKKTKEISGIVAYPGQISGKVKIIRNRREIKNFKTGEILVALMTSPDYIVAIKKAKAIITDDGGLTCHAAIVARELKKPCIVGTKNATKILKTGDLVEINANQGTVKILK